jgi:hypothetical protein
LVTGKENVSPYKCTENKARAGSPRKNFHLAVSCSVRVSAELKLERGSQQPKARGPTLIGVLLEEKGGGVHDLYFLRKLQRTYRTGLPGAAQLRATVTF